MNNDQDQQLVADFVETLREYGGFVIGYSAANHNGYIAAARRAEEIIGQPVEIIDSGIHEEGYGSLHIKIAGRDERFDRSKIPQSVVRAYEEAHKSDPH